MRQTLFGILLAGLAAVGCDSSGDKVPVHPVSGQVLYDGKPAAGVQVFFSPTDAPAVPEIPQNPRGVTGPDGRFTLTTYTPNDGAAEGNYQVILIWPQEKGEGEDPSDNDRLLGWYTAAHSRLEVRVKPGENNLQPFKLPPRTTPPQEGSEGIPGRN